MKSDTDDGLSSCSNFPERSSSYELESYKPVLPEIEHLKGKTDEGDFELLREGLNRNADVFSRHKADIGCCNFVEHEIELEEGAVPHRKGARRMTPHKSEACRAWVLRKKDREKTGFACELGLYQWKRMPSGLCNATATFQRLMAQALTRVTKKYRNLVMCYVDDVVIATLTLEDHIDRLDEVFGCMKRAGLKCKPSKCEIFRDSIKYLGRMVDRHGVRPDPEAVEAKTMERQRDWNHGQIWCGENDKQRRKHIRPGKRLCEYGKFRDANWGE